MVLFTTIKNILIQEQSERKQLNGKMIFFLTTDYSQVGKENNI